MTTAREMHKLFQDELLRVSKSNAQQHADIMALVQSNTESIQAIQENTQELIKLHNDAKTVVRVSKNAGTVIKWIALPVAAISVSYNWIISLIADNHLIK